MILEVVDSILDCFNQGSRIHVEMIRNAELDAAAISRLITFLEKNSYEKTGDFYDRKAPMAV